MNKDTEKNFTGVITALVTPFNKGEVDFKSLGKLVTHQLEQGVHGFVVNGTTAESPTLSPDEVEQIFKFVHGEVAGQVPIVVGTGSNSTAQTVEFTRTVSTWGADAVLTVVPYYNRPPQRGLVAHFKAIAEASKIPVILYNVPSRTVAGFEAKTVGALSELEKIVGIKEATGNMELLAQMQKVAGDNFTYLSGDDGTCVDFCLRGGDGVISVSSHIIGREMVEYLERAEQGDKQADSEYRQRYAEFMKHLYIEANPIPVKMALHWQGILASPELRLPLVELDKPFHKDFQACLKKLELL